MYPRLRTRVPFVPHLHVRTCHRSSLPSCHVHVIGHRCFRLRCSSTLLSLRAGGVSPQLAQQQTAVALSRLGRENRQLHGLLQGAMRERLQGLVGGLREAGGHGEEQGGAGRDHTDAAY